VDAALLITGSLFGRSHCRDRYFSGTDILSPAVQCGVSGVYLEAPLKCATGACFDLLVITFWQRRPNLTRYLAFPITCSMLTYDVFAGSGMGLVNEVFTLISTTVGVIQHAREHRSKRT